MILFPYAQIARPQSVANAVLHRPSPAPLEAAHDSSSRLRKISTPGAASAIFSASNGPQTPYSSILFLRNDVASLTFLVCLAIVFLRALARNLVRDCPPKLVNFVVSYSEQRSLSFVTSVLSQRAVGLCWVLVVEAQGGKAWRACRETSRHSRQRWPES
jgi:hypothetical protein